MITKEDVEKYLSEFKAKAKIFGIIYRDDRKKNIDAITALDIQPIQRTKVVMSLTTQDFSEVLTDTLNKSSDMWVFGKNFKNKEIYIKITMSDSVKQTICISFHIAEHPIKYPFK